MGQSVRDSTAIPAAQANADRGSIPPVSIVVIGFVFVFDRRQQIVKAKWAVDVINRLSCYSVAIDTLCMDTSTLSYQISPIRL